MAEWEMMDGSEVLRWRSEGTDPPFGSAWFHATEKADASLSFFMGGCSILSGL